MSLNLEFFGESPTGLGVCTVPRFGCAEISDELPPAGGAQPQPHSPSDPNDPFHDPGFPCNESEKAIASIDLGDYKETFYVSNLTKTTARNNGLVGASVPGIIIPYVGNDNKEHIRFFALNEGASYPASSIPEDPPPIPPYDPNDKTVTVNAVVLDCDDGSQDSVDCRRVGRWNSTYQRAITDDGARNMMADWNAGPFRISSRSHTVSTDFTISNAANEASMTVQSNSSGDSEFAVPSLTIDGARGDNVLSSEFRVSSGDSGFVQISENTLKTTVGDLTITVPSSNTAIDGVAKKINIGDSTAKNSFSTIDMGTLTQSLSSGAKIQAIATGSQINAGAPGSMVIPYIKNSQMSGVQKKLGMIWIDKENSLLKISFDQTISVTADGVIVSEPNTSIQPSNKILMLSDGIIVSSPGTLNHNVYPGGEVLHSFTIG